MLCCEVVAVYVALRLRTLFRTMQLHRGYVRLCCLSLAICIVLVVYWLQHGIYRYVDPLFDLVDCSDAIDLDRVLFIVRSSRAYASERLPAVYDTFFVACHIPSFTQTTRKSSVAVAFTTCSKIGNPSASLRKMRTIFAYIDCFSNERVINRPPAGGTHIRVWSTTSSGL